MRPVRRQALAAASRIGDLLSQRFLGLKRPRLVNTGSTEMNLAPAHALCLLYDRTGVARYLELSRQIVDEFAATDAQNRPLAGDYLRRGLAAEPFFTTPKPRWESLHPILALAALYRTTSEARFLSAFENLWWSIAELDRHNNGGFSSGEQAQGNPYHKGAIETCCTIAWMAMSVEMLRISGNPIVADELELSTLNSALGLFSPTGRWSTYNTPMDGVRKANYHDIVFQSRPGSPEAELLQRQRRPGTRPDRRMGRHKRQGRALSQLVRPRQDHSTPPISRLGHSGATDRLSRWRKRSTSGSSPGRQS